MKKSPLERILSLKERRKIFESLAKNETPIVLKTNQSEMGILTPIKVDEAGDLLGQLKTKKAWKKDLNLTAAVFWLGKDRFFIKTKIQKLNELWKLQMTSEFFKLNRRNAYRITLADKTPLYFNIRSIRNIDFNRKVKVVEISSQGARIQWPYTMNLRKGDIMKAQIEWDRIKDFDVYAELVHQPSENEWGVKFVRMNSIVANRIKLLSIEIQHQLL